MEARYVKHWELNTAPGHGLVMTDNEAAALLVLSAIGLAKTECPVDDCENCNNTRALWWDVSNQMAREVRVAYQRHMTEAGIPFPEGPWTEEAPFAGVGDGE